MKYVVASAHKCPSCEGGLNIEYTFKSGTTQTFINSLPDLYALHQKAVKVREVCVNSDCLYEYRVK